MLGNGEQNYGYKRDNFATVLASEQDSARGKLLKSHNVLVAHQSADNIKKRHHIVAPASEGAQSYYSSSKKVGSFLGTSQNYVKKQQLEKQSTNFQNRNIPNRNVGYKIKNPMRRSAICSRRIHELAQPNRRYVLESWQQHAFRYTPAMADAARKRLAGIESPPVSIEDPEDYYASLKTYLRNCRQARIIRRRNAAAKKKREMIKEVTEWSQNLSILFTKEISKIMDQAHLFKISPRVLAVSKRVLKGLMDHLNEKAPTGNNRNNLTKKVLTQMANAIAFWINAVISETDGTVSDDVETTDLASSTSSVVDEEEISQDEEDLIENISLGEIRSNSANVMKVSRYIINELMKHSSNKTTSLNLNDGNDTEESTPKEIVASILSSQPETKNILQKLLNILSMAGEQNVFYGDTNAENITFGEIINRIKTLTNSKPEMEAKKNIIKNKLKEKIIKLVKHKKSQVLDKADMKNIISEVAAEISKWLDIKEHVPQLGEKENTSLATASSEHSVESTSLEVKINKDSMKIEDDIDIKCYYSNINGDEFSDDSVHTFKNSIMDVMQENNIEDEMKIKGEISQHKAELHISKELSIQLTKAIESEEILQPVKKTHGEINLQLSNRLKIEKLSKINKELQSKVSKEEGDTQFGNVKELQSEKISQSGKKLQEAMNPLLEKELQCKKVLQFKQDKKTTPFSQVTDQATNTDVDDTEVQPGNQIIEVVLQKLKDNATNLHKEFNTKLQNIDEANIINDLIDFSSNPLKFSQAKISVIDGLIKDKHKALGGEVTAEFSTIIMDYINLLKNIMDSTYKWQSWVKSTNDSAKKIAAAQKLETKSSKIDLSDNTWKSFIQRVDRKALLWRQYNNYALSIAYEIENNIIAHQLQEYNTATEEAINIETERKESNSVNCNFFKQKCNSSSGSFRNKLCMCSSKSNICQHSTNSCNSNKVNSRPETACDSYKTEVFLKENVTPNINKTSNTKEKVDLTKREHSRQGKRKESKDKMKIKESSSKQTIFLMRPGTPISSSQKCYDYQLVSNSLPPKTPNVDFNKSSSNRFQKQLKDQVQETKVLMNKTQHWGKWMHNMVQKATQINENKVDDTDKSKFYKKMNKDVQAWKLYKEYATQQADQQNRKLIEMNGRKDIEEEFTKRILQVEDFAEKTKMWAEWMKSVVKKTESALKVETPNLNKVKEKMRNEVPKWRYFRQYVENVISKDADSKNSIQIETGKREYVEPVQETNAGKNTNFTEPIDEPNTTYIYRSMFEEYDNSFSDYDEN